MLLSVRHDDSYPALRFIKRASYQFTRKFAARFVIIIASYLRRAYASVVVVTPIYTFVYLLHEYIFENKLIFRDFYARAYLWLDCGYKLKLPSARLTDLRVYCWETERVLKKISVVVLRDAIFPPPPHTHTHTHTRLLKYKYEYEEQKYSKTWSSAMFLIVALSNA